MEKILLAFLASAAFCGTASALCDNTTASKIRSCVFKSDLLSPATLPSDETGVTGYCNGNATNNCLATNLGECSDNDRQTKLMNNLLSHNRITDGQMYVCENKTVLSQNYDCLQDFLKSEVQDCFKDAEGINSNYVDSTDLKANLDNMCKFFNAYAMCFDNDSINENCKKVASVFKDAVNGIKYAYCDLDENGRKNVVDEYIAVGGSSFVTGSVLTVLSAYVLSRLY